MSRVVQEKFQVNEPQNSNDDGHNGWISDASARTNKGTADTLRTRYNLLPPGADIDDQRDADIRTQSMAGCLESGTQVTDDVTATSLRQGFDRKSLRPTDDMYTREHNDAFYDSVVVDGVEGYLERNNMLDRE